MGGGKGRGGMQRRGLPGSSSGGVEVVVDEELGTVAVVQPQQVQQQQQQQQSQQSQQSQQQYTFTLMEGEGEGGEKIEERELFGWGEGMGEGEGGKVYPTVAFLEEGGELFFVNLLNGRMGEREGEGRKGTGELKQFCRLLGGGGGVRKVFAVDEKGREEGELSMGKEEVEGMWGWVKREEEGEGGGEEGGGWYECMTKKRGGCGYLVVGGGKGVGVLCLRTLKIASFVPFSSLLSSTPPSLGPRLGPGVGGGMGGGEGGGEKEMVHFSLVSKGGEQVCVCIFGGGGVGGGGGDVVVLSLLRLELLYLFKGAGGRVIRLPVERFEGRRIYI